MAQLKSAILGCHIEGAVWSPQLVEEEVGFGISKLRVQAILSEGSRNIDVDTVVNKLVHLAPVGSAEFIAFGKHPW